LGYNWRIMLKRLRVIAIGVLPWVISGGAIGRTIVFVASKQHRATQQYEAEREKRCASSFPAPGDAEKQDACKHELDSGLNYLPWWYVLLTWPEGITTWGILATGFVIAWQSNETRKAAKASRDAITLQHRPRIRIRSLRVERKDSGEFEIRLTIRNSGETVAHLRESEMEIMWLKDEVVTDTFKRKISPIDLRPGERKTYHFWVPELYVKFETSRLILEQHPTQDQTAFLAFSGTLTYTDEIGTRRETAISRLYVFRSESFVPTKNTEGEYSD
jgi:hypothetical protein